MMQWQDTTLLPLLLSEISDQPAGNLLSTISESHSRENLDCFSPPQNPAKKRKEKQTVDPLEMHKLDLLQEMSVAIKRPAADCDGTFRNQVAEELTLIENPVFKTRLKRKIMNNK